MSSGKLPPDALQDYFDSLLHEEPVVANARAVEEAPIKIAASGNIATLPSAPRPARPAPTRPYAEPIRTLNLRMPLPSIAPAEPVVEVPVAAPTVKVEAEQRIAVEQRIEIEPVETPAVIVSPPQAPEPEVAAAKVSSVDADLADLTTMAPPADWLANGRPAWAQQPFECLIFKAGGLQLAAPLVELGSIYPLAEDELTSIFGQTSWLMGLLPIKEYNVRAMDTALVVMPERYDTTLRANYRFIITLFGSDWGLAVDAVVGTLVLDPEQVRWRGQRGKRPWLAGTLTEQMCALFDIAQLAWLFHTQDRKRAPA